MLASEPLFGDFSSLWIKWLVQVEVKEVDSIVLVFLVFFLPSFVAAITVKKKILLALELIEMFLDSLPMCDKNDGFVEL